MQCCANGMMHHIPEELPTGAAHWFPRQKDMLAEYSRREDRSDMLCVSWDRQNGSNAGSKVFAVFASPAKYFSVIQQMPVGTVCGYEMILEGERCKLYLDVEWETPSGPDAQATAIVRAICAAIVDKSRTMLRSVAVPDSTPAQLTEAAQAWQDLELHMYVSTCSRSKGAVFKNSFHVVVHNVIFPNNHDGMMKEFVTGLEFPEYIDATVYSRNRCIRTELSAKRGEKACFQNTVPLAPDHSLQQRTQQLVASLITHFDRALPSVCFKNHAAWLEQRQANNTHKRSSLIITSASCKKARSETAEVAVLLDAYFKHIFCDETQTHVTAREIRDTDPLPPVVRELVKRLIVKPSDISFVYIEKAKWCISKLMHAEKHKHHSNNACAVAVRVDGRMDIYARCYGCKSTEYAGLASFKKNLLPSLANNDAFRRIVHSPYGIECVLDSADRKRVVILFQKTQGYIKDMLDNANDNKKYTTSLAYLWCKYVQSASRGWFFISEPCHPPQT